MYKRSKNGDMIHRAGCRLAKNGVEWNWAEGKSEPKLRAELKKFPDYKFCKVCFGDEDREETERQLLRRQLELEQSE